MKTIEKDKGGPSGANAKGDRSKCKGEWQARTRECVRIEIAPPASGCTRLIFREDARHVTGSKSDACLP